MLQPFILNFLHGLVTFRSLLDIALGDSSIGARRDNGVGLAGANLIAAFPRI